MLFVRTLIEDELPTFPLQEVAHYTKIGTLCHFIPDGVCGWGSAWATPIQFLNDRMELSLGLDTLREVATKTLPKSSRVRNKIDSLYTTYGTLGNFPAGAQVSRYH